jgi:hypothetical protein
MQAPVYFVNTASYDRLGLPILHQNSASVGLSSSGLAGMMIYAKYIFEDEF